MPTSLARGTMAFFASATTSFTLAQLAVVVGMADPVAQPAAGSSFAAVHLVTVGWLTVLVLGALRQFLPVITASRPVGDRLALASLVAVDLGLGGMVLGFLATGGALPAALGLALPAGGALVVVGVAGVALPLLRLLRDRRPLPLQARFVAAGIAFLFLTVLLGVTLGVALAAPSWLTAGFLVPLLTRGLPLHLGLGIGGFLTLTAMGVAYKLLAMFMLAPEHRGPIGEWVFRLAFGGLALAALADVLRVGLAWAGAGASAGLSGAAQALSALAWAGGGLAALGVALYLWDVRRMYRERRRRELELNGRWAAWAFAALALGVMGLIVRAVAGAFGGAGPAPGALVYLFLVGWLSGLGLSQMYKIVPFLTWVERFGSRLGRGPVPRVQDLVVESRAEPWFRLYFAGVAAGFLAFLFGSGDGLRAASLATLVATAAIAREVWRARHVAPEPQTAPWPMAHPAWPPAARGAVDRRGLAPLRELGGRPDSGEDEARV